MCFNRWLRLIRFDQLQTRLHILADRIVTRYGSRSKLTEDNTVRNCLADRHVEPKAHGFVDVSLQHAALDLIAKLMKELFNSLAAKIGWVCHVFFPVVNV